MQHAFDTSAFEENLPAELSSY